MPTMLQQKPFYKLKIEVDDMPLNPRKDYDNFGHMICWHSRYSLGDEHNYDEPKELLRQMIRETLTADEVIDYMKKAKLDDLRLIYSRSDREWQLQDEYNGKWFNEYTFFPGTLKGSDMAKECVLELLPINALKELADRKNVILPLYLYDHSGITMNNDGFSCPWDSGQVGWIYASHQEVKDEYGNLSRESLDKAENLLRGETKTYDHYICGECYGFIIEENGQEVDSVWGFLGDLREIKEDMLSHVSDEHKHLFEHIDYGCMEYSEGEDEEMEDEYDM